MKQTKRIAEYNLGVFVQQIADFVAQGWAVSPTFPAGTYGFLYEVELVYEGDPPEPPMSRAEVLAKARAAKAAKQAARAEESQEETE